MNQQIDPNVFSALCIESEESDSDDMSALMLDPDLGREQPLSIRELQESSETGGEERSRVGQPQQEAHDYESEEEKAEENDEGSPPMNQSPLEPSGEQDFRKVAPVATVPPAEVFNNPASQDSKIGQSNVQARDQVRTGKVTVPQPAASGSTTIGIFLSKFSWQRNSG